MSLEPPKAKGERIKRGHIQQNRADANSKYMCMGLSFAANPTSPRP